MLPAEFEPPIPASERQQTIALDRSTTGATTLLLKCVWACTAILIVNFCTDGIRVRFTLRPLYDRDLSPQL